MSVHDKLRHRRYGCSDGASVGDELVGENGSAMRPRVSERELVGERDGWWTVSGRVARVRKRDNAR